ncbi:hypothetical protein [Bacteroides mediterraneensis]|uniref:hypothetical protein n=1 Tax=Bacteroides mediterraneensis TaxID=1841856 RepID=UPI00195CFB2B|nr:hypothetical protein [Bacteroides mediterraneensis]MBM6654851.1 hypothetical protein [Bacteroides mediterraneensis]MBM6781472.1 hypothetical protein [Bacteroides mediterraneensis]
MKISTFIIISISLVLLFIYPAVGLSVIAISGFIYIAIHLFKRKNSDTILNDCADIRLPYPGPSYSYYEMVGMRFRDLDSSDYGIHNNALAIAENNNPYDSCAVGIYRTDKGFFKLVGYIPSDMNKELHKCINSIYGGRTLATYKIWKRGDKIYGIAYIKDNG